MLYIKCFNTNSIASFFLYIVFKGLFPSQIIQVVDNVDSLLAAGNIEMVAHAQLSPFYK